MNVSTGLSGLLSLELELIRAIFQTMLYFIVKLYYNSQLFIITVDVDVHLYYRFSLPRYVKEVSCLSDPCGGSSCPIISVVCCLVHVVNVQLIIRTVIVLMKLILILSTLH